MLSRFYPDVILNRQRRMRQWGEFQSVRKHGQSAAGKFLVLGTHSDSSLTEPKFGLITSKKAGNAVTRNRLRRLFREIIRKWGDHLPRQQRFVTIARWNASKATLQELEADWIKVAKRLKIWNENP